MGESNTKFFTFHATSACPGNMDCFLSFLSQYWLFAWYILTCRTLSHPEDYLFSSVYTISYPFSFLSPFIDIWSKPPLSTAPFLQDPSILFSSLQYWNYSLCGLIISNCQIYVLSLHSLWVLHHLNTCEYFLPFLCFPHCRSVTLYYPHDYATLQVTLFSFVDASLFFWLPLNLQELSRVLFGPLFSL